MKVIENPGTMMLLPAAPGTCPICAVKHDPEQPHNQQSLYYQMHHQMEHGRGATWEDAMAHCSEEIKVAWIVALGEHGVVVGSQETEEAK